MGVQREVKSNKMCQHSAGHGVVGGRYGDGVVQGFKL